MFLLNKVTAAKLSSRELTQDVDRAEFQQDMSGMDYMYVGASEFRPKSSRSKNSKPRTSFFGAKRRSGVEADASSKESLPLPPTSPRRTLNEKPSMGSLSSGSRRRLRKASSKTSLAASFLSQGSDESRPVSRVDQLLGRGLGAQATTIASSRSRGASISQPFNFTHLSHADQRDANAIPAGANEVGKEWNRALVRESHMRPLTAKASMTSLHSRENSIARERANSALPMSVSPQNRSNSAMSISPAGSCLDLAAVIPPVPALQEPLRNACPITPPLRASSRHCLRILEHPEEEHVRRENVDIPEVSLTEFEEGEVGAAVTTPGDSSFGSKSDGIDRVQSRTSRDGLDPWPASPPVDASFEPLFDESRFPTDISNMPYVERYNPERFTPPAINLMPPFDPTSRLLPPRSRPLSQMSAVSDTLNGHFAIPSGPMKNRRLSRRISAIRRSTGPPNADGSSPAGNPMSADDWEQDIDWCYEHEADADCDFNWDKGSAYSASIYSPIEEEEAPARTIPVPVLPERTVAPPPRKTFNQTIEVPELRQQSLIIEKRITGLFEDKLLLPPSPGYPPTPRSPPQHYKSARDRERDSGFASVRSIASTEEPAPPIRIMRHRSISSSPSMPDLGLIGRSGSYREELCRVAKQLNDHIAALNKDVYHSAAAAVVPPPRNPAAADGPIPTFTIGNRARANSEVTCVTLCSDTDTVTPTEANEIITPSSSAHNSYNFMKPRSSSVVGGGLAVESRAEKSMSFPSAAIPGVIEVGPDSSYHPEETEFVHFF